MTNECGCVYLITSADETNQPWPNLCQSVGERIRCVEGKVKLAITNATTYVPQQGCTLAPRMRNMAGHGFKIERVNKGGRAATDCASMEYVLSYP